MSKQKYTAPSTKKGLFNISTGQRSPTQNYHLIHLPLIANEHQIKIDHNKANDRHLLSAMMGILTTRKIAQITVIGILAEVIRTAIQKLHIGINVARPRKKMAVHNKK